MVRSLFVGALLAQVASSLRVNFFENGIHFPGTIPETVELPADYEKLSCSELLVNIKGKLSPTFVDKFNFNVPPEKIPEIWNGRGHKVESTSAIVEGDNLYLVPEEYIFMWPSVDIGHQIELDWIDTEITDKPKMIIETISLSPRAFYLHNYLNNDETEHIIEKNQKKLKPSTVGSGPAGTPEAPRQDPGRTSLNTFDSSSDAAQSIIKKGMSMLRLPFDMKQVDGLQIVNYEPGHFYNRHHDYLELSNADGINSLDPKTGGTNRWATIFPYVLAPDKGGQTGFPSADHLSDADMAKLSERARTSLNSFTLNTTEVYDQLLGILNISEKSRLKQMERNMVKDCFDKLSVQPHKGDGVLFYNMHPDFEFDTMSLHGGCPVLEGEKMAANLWVWNGPRPSGDTSKNFVNTLDVPVELFWENTLQTKLAPGDKSSQNTFHAHLFHAKIDGKLVFTYRVAKDGPSSVMITRMTLEELENAKKVRAYRVSLKFTNTMGVPLDMFWSDQPIGVLPTEGRLEQTYDGHEFTFKLKGQVVHTHVVDGTKGYNYMERVIAMKSEL